MEQTLNEKVEQMKMLEYTLYNILTQKQVLKQQLDEIENAEKELENLSENKKVYKMIGVIMVEKNKDELIKELKEKKEIISLRIDSLDKQEKRLRERLEKLQEEIKRIVEEKKKSPLA